MTVHERPFGRYLEDFTPGDILRHWPGKTITEYHDHLFCMITMNHHPLHTNDWFAAESVQGRNVVVGNLVYSLVLGMSVPDVNGAAIANLEIETLQHKFPTFHGDTIHAETRVLEVKESSSKPDRGIVTVETKGFNQDGKEVCYFKRKVLIWKRDAAPDRKRPYDGTEVCGDGASLDRPARCSAWGVPQLRELPWRFDRDPWKVLVAEVMLRADGRTGDPQVAGVSRGLPRSARVLVGLARRRSAAVAGPRLPPQGAATCKRPPNWSSSVTTGRSPTISVRC